MRKASTVLLWKKNWLKGVKDKHKVRNLEKSTANVCECVCVSSTYLQILHGATSDICYFGASTFSKSSIFWSIDFVLHSFFHSPFKCSYLSTHTLALSPLKAGAFSFTLSLFSVHEKFIDVKTLKAHQLYDIFIIFPSFRSSWLFFRFSPHTLIAINKNRSPSLSRSYSVSLWTWTS